jgi:hypothetical protein
MESIGIVSKNSIAIAFLYPLPIIDYLFFSIKNTNKSPLESITDMISPNADVDNILGLCELCHSIVKPNPTLFAIGLESCILPPGVDLSGKISIVDIFII